MAQKIISLIAAIFIIYWTANPGTAHSESTLPFADSPRGQPMSDPKSESPNKIGRTAETGSGDVGQREQPIAMQSIGQSLGRVDSRINSRIDNRLSWRIDRSYAPNLEVTSSIKAAESEIQNANPKF